MQILKYYINHKGGINNLLVCRVVNHRLCTIKTYTGDTALKRANNFLNKQYKNLWKSYNERGINIDPHSPEARKMKTRKISSVHINLSKMGFANFPISGNLTGMRKVYGKGALIVKQDNFYYDVTSAPDIYYQHAI